MTKTWRVRNRVMGCAAFVLTCGVAASALAADVSGHWAGTVKPGNGREVPFSADFKQQGTDVTGELSGVAGGAGVVISNGKNTGDTITWTATRPLQAGPVTFNYTGKLSGDAMDIQIVRADGTGAPQSAHVERAH